MHQASSIVHQASSIKHQASCIMHQASCIKQDTQHDVNLALKNKSKATFYLLLQRRRLNFTKFLRLTKFSFDEY